MLLTELFLAESLPDHASWQTRFDLKQIDNRRFMFDPKTKKFIIGDALGTGKSKGIHKSHAEEYFDVVGSNDGFDRMVRGWVGAGSDYPHGIIHFAPGFTPQSKNFDEGFACLMAFRSCGATGQTVVRSFMRNVDEWEQPMSDIFGLPDRSLKELFDRKSDGIEFIRAQKVRNMSTGPGTPTKYACKFSVGENQYVVYLTQPTDFSKGSYMLGFGLYSEEKHGLRHEVLDRNIPSIDVYNGVIAATEMLIGRARPKVLAMIGYSQRQNVLYPKILKKLKNRLPEYEIDAENMILVKNSK